MVVELITLGVVLVMIVAEWLHARRTRAVAALVFGPTKQPSPWVYLAAPLRIVAVGGLAWGLMTLLILTPRVHKLNEIPEAEYRDLLLLLDVSPSMRLVDAGGDGKQSRRKRASDLLKSFFDRVPMEVYRTSVVAFYTGAKPVVVRTMDAEVVRNILEDLPLEYAFKSGATNLFAGLEEAARVARPWRPRSTILLIVSDGDTIPASGMPKLPASISHTVVVGVGDPAKGQFVDGHLSRQDASSLRQLATRLGGVYHNGNEKHLSTQLIREVTLRGREGIFDKLTRREYALIACALGASILALLPVILHLAGTRWKPGVHKDVEASIAA